MRRVDRKQFSKCLPQQLVRLVDARLPLAEAAAGHKMLSRYIPFAAPKQHLNFRDQRKASPNGQFVLKDSIESRDLINESWTTLSSNCIEVPAPCDICP